MYYDDYEESYYDYDYDEADEEALDMAVDMSDRYGIDADAAYDFITTENAKRMMKARERKYERNTGNKIGAYRERYDPDKGDFYSELNPNSYRGRQYLKTEGAKRSSFGNGSGRIDDGFFRSTDKINRYREIADDSSRSMNARIYANAMAQRERAVQRGNVDAINRADQRRDRIARNYDPRKK